MLPLPPLVLLMIADEDVRHDATRLLKSAGYAVLPADDAEQALHWLEDDPGIIEVLFTDPTLPGTISGRELASRGKAARPSLAVAYTTCLDGWRARPPPAAEIAGWLHGRRSASAASQRIDSGAP
jgi:DNA-binding NtrC family response regulator